MTGPPLIGPMASRRVAPRDDVALMEGYHSPQVDVPVRLNTNESPYPPPPAFGPRLAAAVGQVAWHRYPDRAATELRRRIGALHGVGPEQVFVANGSNEVLQTLLLTYAGAGRSVATFEPTYALHAHIARLSGATVIEGERDEDFALSLAEIDRVMAGGPGPAPHVVFLCSPNNPTGCEEPRPLVEAVLERVRAAGALLVMDEAYGQFASWSAQELMGPDQPLVVTRTFSKTWSMAAARLGYLIGPRWVIDELEKVVLPYHLDALKQAAGIIALDFAGDMEARVAAIVTERARVLMALQGLGVRVWPSGANFVLLRAEVPGGGGALWNALLQRGVLVRNCSSWPRLEGCLRLTIGTPAEDDAFLKAMQSALIELAG
ncbi:MAG: histidinol-phosphate transaminase [Acidimicrobiales bacterium]